MTGTPVVSMTDLVSDTGYPWALINGPNQMYLSIGQAGSLILTILPLKASNLLADLHLEAFVNIWGNYYM